LALPSRKVNRHPSAGDRTDSLYLIQDGTFSQYLYVVQINLARSDR
jgi:hypothetical protein